MKINVGGLDSFVRIFAGVWLSYFWLDGAIGNLGLFGFLLILTGISRYSPTYCVLNLSTAKCEQEAH